MSNDWKQQRELGSLFWIRLLAGLSLLLGRKVIQILLVPITTFYLFTAGEARRSSRRYLEKVSSQPVSIFHVWRHFYCFVRVNVDRFFFLMKKSSDFDVEIEGESLLQQYAQKKQGCIVLVSHIGSFELVRSRAKQEDQLPLYILMDSQHNQAAMQVINAFDHDLAERIIDANQPAPQLALCLQEHLKQGHIIGIMADRCLSDERTVEARLFGGLVNLPQGPWLLAAVLKVPVLHCCSLYMGGGCYQITVKLISEGMDCPRRERHEQFAVLAQDYCNDMEASLKKAPYNWFNFYDYWNTSE